MAQNTDTERQTPTPSNEQTPLLGDHQPAQRPEEQPEEPEQSEEEPKPKPTSWYLWRGFWFVLGALVLALFIKGWVDSGDVDVSFWNLEFISV